MSEAIRSIEPMTGARMTQPQLLELLAGLLAGGERLRRAGLIEGRAPQLHVAASVAAVTDHKPEYIRARAMDDTHYERLILDYLTQFGGASRGDLEALLGDKFADTMDADTKARKLSNLLTKLKRRGQIKNEGSRGGPSWSLV